MGSKTSTNTVTEKSDPWAPAQPYLRDVMGKAQGLYNSGSTVAPQNPTLLSGYQNMLNTANYSPSTTNASMGLMNDTIGGKYFNNNPYLDAAYDKAASKVTDSVNSNFSMAGRYGSGAHTGVLGDSLGDMATNLYGSAYQTERQNQLSAGQFAPQLDAAYQNMLFNNANARLGVGQSMQDYNQMVASEPYSRLNNYSAIVNGYGGLGGSGTSTGTQPGGSVAGGVLGGAGTGFAVGNALFPGIGGIAGGVLGGIGGLF